MKCEVGYIYALLHKGIPFYIGQSVHPKNRYMQHRYNSFVLYKKKDVYDFLRSVTTADMFRNDISMRIITCCSISQLRYNEVKVIKHCIKKNVKIYNSCVISNTLKTTT